MSLLNIDDKDNLPITKEYLEKNYFHKIKIPFKTWLKQVFLLKYPLNFKMYGIFTYGPRPEFVQIKVVYDVFKQKIIVSYKPTFKYIFNYVPFHILNYTDKQTLVNVISGHCSDVDVEIIETFHINTQFDLDIFLMNYNSFQKNEQVLNEFKRRFSEAYGYSE